VRPDPLFVNIIALSTIAASAGLLNVFTSLSVRAAFTPLNQTAAHGMEAHLVSSNYSTGRLENNTDGPYSLPASGRRQASGGPSRSDRKHRFNIGSTRAR
jgi:hypothetical protein